MRIFKKGMPSMGRWIRFSVVLVLYVLFVVWVGNYWWLLGVPILFDLYLSQWVHWFFWRERDVKRQKGWVEWVDALIFATVAAVILRMFFFEAFTIPTGSMEKSLLIGDYLFVSKVAYGPKLPNTPVALPFTHHTLPLTKNTPSYWKGWQRPYNRRAGLGHVQRGDVVVFHFPEGDTVIAEMPDRSYYAVVRELGRDYVHKHFKLLIRPVDRRENYIKRCVGVAGDTLSIQNGWVYVNGERQEYPPTLQSNYVVQTTGMPINTLILSKMGISQSDQHWVPSVAQYRMPLTQEMVAQLDSVGNVLFCHKYVSIDPAVMSSFIFPHKENYLWTEDNFGPLWIPERGVTLPLTVDNLPLYRRAIEVYEGHEVTVDAQGVIRIDGEVQDRYTFTMDYYFMMGDNRHNSLDSRYWGFVPEDHVVGKATVVWLSLDREKHFPVNVRWRRGFTRIR